MKKKSPILLILTLFFCFPFLVMGQNIFVGGGIGIANYQGDIASEKLWTPEKFNFGANLFVTKNINHKWSVRGGLLLSKLTGSDSHYFDDPEHGRWRKRRNYSFNTSIIELSGMAKWNFLDKKVRRFGFHPYLLGGVGLAYSAVDSKESEDSNVNFVLPFGAGVSKDISERVSIGMELVIRKTFSDELDGFSDNDGLGEGDDWYTYFSVNMSYEFGKKWEIDKIKTDF